MSDFDVPPRTRRERREARADAGAPVILTVCTGNICRSPQAEMLLRARLRDLDVRVHSAGTRALVDREMDRTAQELALLQEPLADDADLVLAMSREHRTAAVELSPRHLRHTFTVREFARLAASLDDGVLRRIARSAGNPRSRFGVLVQAVADQRGVAPRAAGDEDVIDPYRQSLEVYEQSAAQMLPALDQVERVVRIALA